MRENGCPKTTSAKSNLRISEAVAALLRPPCTISEAAVLPCESFDVFFPPHTHLPITGLPNSEEGSSVTPSEPVRTSDSASSTPGNVNTTAAHSLCCEGNTPPTRCETHSDDRWKGVSIDESGQHLAVCQCKERCMYKAALSYLAPYAVSAAVESEISFDFLQAAGWVRLALFVSGSCPLALRLSERRVQLAKERAVTAARSLNSSEDSFRRQRWGGRGDCYSDSELCRSDSSCPGESLFGTNGLSCSVERPAEGEHETTSERKNTGFLQVERDSSVKRYDRGTARLQKSYVSQEQARGRTNTGSVDESWSSCARQTLSSPRKKAGRASKGRYDRAGAIRRTNGNEGPSRGETVSKVPHVETRRRTFSCRLSRVKSEPENIPEKFSELSHIDYRAGHASKHCHSHHDKVRGRAQNTVHPGPQDAREIRGHDARVTDDFPRAWEELYEELSFIKLLLELHPKSGDLWAYRRCVWRAALGVLKAILEAPVDTHKTRQSLTDKSEDRLVKAPRARGDQKGGDKGRWRGASHSSTSRKTRTCAWERLSEVPRRSARGREAFGSGSVSERHERAKTIDQPRRLSFPGRSENNCWWAIAQARGLLKKELELIADQAAQRPHSYQPWEHFSKIEKAYDLHAFPQSPSGTGVQAQRLLVSLRSHEVRMSPGEKRPVTREEARTISTEALIENFLKKQCGLLAHTYAPHHHWARCFDAQLSRVIDAFDYALDTSRCKQPPDTPCPSTFTKEGQSISASATALVRQVAALLRRFARANEEILSVFPHLEAPWCGRSSLFVSYIRRYFSVIVSLTGWNGQKRAGLPVSLYHLSGSSFLTGISDQPGNDSFEPGCSAHGGPDDSPVTDFCQFYPESADDVEKFLELAYSFLVGTVQQELRWCQQFAQRKMQEEALSLGDERVDLMQRWLLCHSKSLERELFNCGC